jgi:hypothetical protein
MPVGREAKTNWRFTLGRENGLREDALVAVMIFLPFSFG